jgi:monofunctional biosynthetic peptidoglycan transglycosylase
MRYLTKRNLFLFLTAFLAWTLYFRPDWIFGYSLPPDQIKFEEAKPRSLIEIFDHQDRVVGYQIIDDSLVTLYRPLSRISKHLQNFVVFLEDAKFHSHKGFDVEEIKNSLEDKLSDSKRLRGASTITQQLAKNLFLDKQRSLLRKLFEVPWTLAIEKDLTKSQILELYLNVIEWGPGIHGAEMASRHYFDKTAAELNQGEALFLALIIPNPVRFDPFSNSRNSAFLADKRQAVIERWIREKKLSGPEASAAIQARWELVRPGQFDRKYFTFHTAKYDGNRLAKNSPWTELSDNFLKIFGGGSQSKYKKVLSLNWPLQLELNKLETVRSDFPEQFLILKEAQSIRAFRKFKKSTFLDPGHLLELEKRGYTVEKSNQLNWNQIKK